ncbi:MAG TPA: metallophosphoesterase [Roseiflexaceae bacterium]|nr:metallophosphoesterase [Roseiflexaceae bacterium]
MRLAYSADLHGDIDSYRALLELAAAAGAQAAIVGGDLLPHAIALKSALQVQRDFIAERLRPLLAWFRGRHPQIDVYLLAGNDDWAGAIADLDQLERERLAFPLHERVYSLIDKGPSGRGGGEGTKEQQALAPSPPLPFTPSEGLWLAGYACVPLTPFSIKDYERRDDGPLPPFSFGMAYTSQGGEIQPTRAETIAAQPSIAEALAALARQSDPRRTVYVCHSPPANTPLDQMPRGRHVGSKALRAFIEQHAPPLTLHGHIHESPAMSGRYAARLGRTWSINPGHDPLRFQAVTLDTDDLAGTIEHTVFGRLNITELEG